MDAKQVTNNRGVIYSVDKLIKEMEKILINEYDNLKLKNELKEEFANKGLNPAIVNLIISNEKSIKQLTEYERMALAKGCYNIFPNNNDLNISNYFPQKIIDSYENCHLVAIYPEIIKLKNFQKKNEDEYVGLVSYKDIFEYIGSDLLSYEIDIQRQPEYKMLGNKQIVNATINDKAVKDIRDAILKNEFEDTQIVLTFLIKDDGEDLKLLFEPKFDDVIGDITVEGKLKINDGMHRCLGICEAVIAHMQKTGEYLSDSISVRIVRGDSARARRITTQSFKRSATNIDWLKGFEDNDINKFIDELIKQSKVLKDNTAKTYDDYKALKKLTYRTSLMSDTIDKLQIRVTDRKEVLIKSKKMAEYLDAVIGMIDDEIEKEENKNNDYGYVYDANMFIGYLYFSYEMSKKGEEIEFYENMIEKVLTMTEKDKKYLKLNSKSFNINNVINYFKDVFEV